MNCPKCNELVDKEDSKCSNCGTELKLKSFIKVLETGDMPLVTVIKSVLTDADVKFFVKGEGLQNIIGIGSFGMGYNSAIGPMEIYVQEEDAEAVKMLIEELEQNQDIDMDEEEDDNDEF
ncbi:MAG: DUF2007 domain-containing protein [Lutisporaceae bacterium]